MDNANKTFFVMVILTFLCLGVTLFQFMSKSKVDTSANTIEVSEKKELLSEVSLEKNSFILKNKTSYENINSISEEKKSDESMLSLSPSENEINVISYENNHMKVIFDSHSGEILNLFLKSNEHDLYDIVDGNDVNRALKLKLGSWKSGYELKELFAEDTLFDFVKEGKNVYRFVCTFGKVNEEETLYKIEKVYTFFEEEQIFHFDLNISNNQNKAMNFDTSNNVFSLGWGPALGVNSKHDGKKDSRYDQFRYLSNGKIINVGDKNRMFKGTDGSVSIRKSLKDSWVASDSHYFTSVVIPDGNEYNYFFDYRDSENKSFYCGFSLVSNKSIIQTGFDIYCGPKSSKILKQYDNFRNEKVYLSKTDLSKIDPPIIFGLGNLLGWLLNLINHVVKNYGLAIVILTFLLKLILSPLMFNSMKSQQRMQKIQPKMQELQKKYKDKPELLNQKTMDLYRKEGINPMSGCLPLLLQMPFLFAMYQLLDRMFELKGASFLWIKDLSMPDAIITFGFNIPLLNFSSLNILPIIMVISQVIQSLLTPGMENNSQAKMMIWLMPFMFFFFFYNVSSGLVLYWTVMNLLGIVQQLLLNKTLANGKQPSIQKRK